MLKAIFFDLDGVLLDSVEGHFYSWQKILSEFGENVSLHELKLFEGMKSEEMVQEILIKRGVNVSVELILGLQRKKRIYHKANFQAEPFQIYEKLLNLKEMGLKLYVVSGSPKSWVEVHINNFFDGIFDGFISSCDVSLGKPHPQPYLKAFELSGCDIENCLVVENAPLGIRSGKNGGFKVIGIGTSLSKKDLSQADYFVKNHNELFNFIEKNINCNVI